ncbi:hypothetical protein F52700_10848 [Fusarium sp. NRRL 52700]|nr:hypothetical protein F52700_10848 [Fusarium sp. NRRL 52700]
MAPQEGKSFFTSLNGYYNTDALSDVTVTCGGQVFKAHKIILSAHSKCFATALNGNWKEGSEGNIRIDDFDPDVVDAMLRFMYSFEYSSDHDTPRMVFDVRVYQIADKYGITALKNEVKKQFKAAVASEWTANDFSVAANLVYVTTPSRDRGLRDIVMETIRENIDYLVDHNNFDELLRSTPDLAADLISELYGRTASPETQYQCPDCGAQFWVKNDSRDWSCPCCRWRTSDWSEYQIEWIR